MIKTWLKKWTFPRVFEDFLVRSENLQLWVQIFIFFHLQLHFFFIFLCFWWVSIVFHWFSWLSWISGATGKENEKKMIKTWKKWLKNDKKMKNSSSFWRFPGSEWESTTLSPNFHFFHLQLHFFLLSFVFDGFPLFFIVFHGFPGFQVPRAGKMKKKWLKHDKKMKISSSFWRFPGSEWESATLSPNFNFFFICNFIFFHFPLFLDGFPLFFIVFHGFPGFQVARGRKMKKKR